MRSEGKSLNWTLAVALLVFPGTLTLAQQKTVPDAEVESNVLKSLAAIPELADQPIGTTAVYGSVTISGSVSSEELRDKAEQTVARTAGVKKVVDELTVGVPETAPAATQDQPASQVTSDQNAGVGAGANDQAIPSPQPSSGPAPTQQSAQSRIYGSRGQSPSLATPAYRTQQAGLPVTLPAGTVLRVRINQSLDSRHTQPGTAFDGVVLNDINMAGAIAVPRGSIVLGQVVETHPGGDLRGRGLLSLQLTQMTLEGKAYPLVSEPWLQQGYDKAGQTVGTTVGLGAVGAMIGAVAGGGPGALLGAGIGGVAGLGLSSASHQGEAGMPSEAIVTFRLAQQISLLTVSQNELDRLAATTPPAQTGQPAQMWRRYPPPPPYAYGPAPYPYYYPYYR